MMITSQQVRELPGSIRTASVSNLEWNSTYKFRTSKSKFMDLMLLLRKTEKIWLPILNKIFNSWKRVSSQRRMPKRVNRNNKRRKKSIRASQSKQKRVNRNRLKKVSPNQRRMKKHRKARQRKVLKKSYKKVSKKTNQKDKSQRAKEIKTQKMNKSQQLNHRPNLK